MLNRLLKKVKNKFYNRKHHTNIASFRADLSAKYGIGVLIGRDTVVGRTVTIGDYSYVNSDSSVENCDIGKFCSISSGVYINPAEHEIKSRSTYPLFPSKRIQERVHIGNDVLISLNVIVLEGVSIGDGAVIGAGAVVTKNVKPYEIVGGVPAHNIGWRHEPPKVIVDNHAYNWWDFDIDTIKKNENFFNGDTDAFVHN